MKDSVILLDPIKLSIVDSCNREMFITWDQVYRINYYKIDCNQYYLAYLEFDFDFGEYIEVHDQMDGWVTLIDRLDKYLPIQDLEWRNKLNNFPVGTVTTIYQRPD